MDNINIAADLSRNVGPISKSLSRKRDSIKLSGCLSFFFIFQVLKNLVFLKSSSGIKYSLS